MVAPEKRRAAARYLQGQHGVSERRAVRVLGFGRSSHRYRTRKNDQHLVERLTALAQERPRFGYRRLEVLLRREGQVVNQGRVYRIYTALGLAVRKKTRRTRAFQRRAPLVAAQAKGERWSADFVSDQLATGQRFRVLSVVDDFTRECVVCFAATSITGQRVAGLLDQATKAYGKPKTLISDNGPEFTSRALDAWAHQQGVARHFIDPGKGRPERVYRKFQQSPARRVLESALVCRTTSCPAGARRVAARLQRHPTTQLAEQPGATGVCASVGRLK